MVQMNSEVESRWRPNSLQIEQLIRVFAIERSRSSSVGTSLEAAFSKTPLEALLDDLPTGNNPPQPLVRFLLRWRQYSNLRRYPSRKNHPPRQQQLVDELSHPVVFLVRESVIFEWCLESNAVMLPWPSRLPRPFKVQYLSRWPG